jgi:hypothetical protein
MKRSIGLLSRSPIINESEMNAQRSYIIQFVLHDNRLELPIIQPCSEFGHK